LEAGETLPLAPAALVPRSPPHRRRADLLPVRRPILPASAALRVPPVRLSPTIPVMVTNFFAAPTLEKLRQHIHQTLCAHLTLDPEQTPLYQALIMRSGRPCGLFFQINGPRMVKVYALWAGEEDRILFYGSGGERFAEARLTEAPDPLTLGTGPAR